MDGLDEFEKSLAAEKARRERDDGERDERRRHKHRHHHHRHHHRHHDGNGERRRDGHRESRRDDGREEDCDGARHRRRGDGDDGGHRHKRSRRSGGDDDGHRSSTRPRRDDRHVERSGLSDDEKPRSRDAVDSAPLLERDAWMTAPSALDVEHLHRPERKAKLPPKEEPKRVIHKRELNAGHLRALNDGASAAEPVAAAERTVHYTFGDAGSSWRMTKLKAVYSMAESSGRPVDEVALERFGSLEEFDDAQEERDELERRKIYGKGYRERDKPTGELYRERQRKNAAKDPGPGPEPEPEQGTVIPDEAPPALDQTALNRLRAQMMKAKLRGAADAGRLEDEYERAAAAFVARGSDEAVVLGAKDSRQLAGARGEVKAVNTRRGRERGAVEENTDMSIDDMVREVRRTKGEAGGEGMRLAERIAKDSRFDDNLEYMDENAEKLARRVHKNEVSLKNKAVGEFQRMERILDSCPLCHHEDKGRPPLAPVVSLGTRVFLTLATEPEVSEGGAVIVPISHRGNLLECDDDEWEEIRNFMKSLTRMYHEQGRDVVFYENAAAPQRRLHAAMAAVPIPYAEGAMAPAHFREAFLSADEEWSQHAKVIDTAARAREGLGRMAFRRSLAKEMPYFHAWFSLDGGLGHVVEDAGRWPRGDLFAREVLGGIVGAEAPVVRRQGRWTRGDARVEAWRRGWRKFDWTRVLADG